jgi:hypothetical protein
MMVGLTARRPDGRIRRLVVSALVFVLAVGPSGRQAVAQIGHDPGASPYHDIDLHAGAMFFFGHLGADRGNVGVGTSNASTYGVRYEIPAGRVLSFQFTGAYLRGDRFVVDPRADSTAPARRTGPISSNLVQTEIGMQFRLTGGKTWHGLAPYVGTGIGVVFETNGTTDTSGYKFGSKFTLALGSGVRWYPVRHIVVVGDVRAHFWRLKYPASFHENLAPDGSRVIPLLDKLTDWTMHPWVSLGIGWTF